LQTSYIISAQKAHQLPAYDSPEIAFIGRSNCGKSSLLNALLDRKSLARESSTPGRTQMVNFFSVQKADRQVIFADLPGYGFSMTGQAVRQHWEELLDAYFRRPNIERFLFLADCRRAGTLDADDRVLLNYLTRHSDKPLTIVLTKTDKLKQAEISKAQQVLAAQLKSWGVKFADIAAVSSLKKKGIPELKKRVLASLDAPNVTQ
jgi:GTP-binding protein